VSLRKSTRDVSDEATRPRWRSPRAQLEDEDNLSRAVRFHGNRNVSIGNVGRASATHPKLHVPLARERSSSDTTMARVTAIRELGGGGGSAPRPRRSGKYRRG
jgi:hypothetical protein